MPDLNSNEKTSLGSGIASTFLAVVAVALRILTKVSTKGGWATDDSWAIVSLVSLFAWMGVEFWGILLVGGEANIGEIIMSHDIATVQDYIKSLYMLDPIYALTVTTTRLSILYLYRRIFAVPRFRQVSFVVIVVCITWWVVTTIVMVLPCIPIQKISEPQREGHCFNFDEFFLVTSILEIIIDIVILALPVKMIVGLQMSSQRRITLCVIFLLGSFVVVTGLLRLGLTYVPHSVKINFTRGELWTNIHLGTAIVCASLPTYGPWFFHLGAVTVSIRSHFTSLFGSRRPLQSSKPSGGYEIGAYPSGHKQYNHIGAAGDNASLTEAAAAQGSGHSEKYGKGGVWDSQIKI